MAEVAIAAVVGAVKWVASAVVGAAVGGVTATGIAAVATKLAVYAAVSMGAQALAAKQANQVSAQQLEFKADPTAGYDTVFGRTATGGHLVMQQTSESGRSKFKGSILNMFTLLSACGPVAGIDEFHIQGKRQFWNNTTGAVSGSLNSDIWLKTANGSPTQNAITAPAWPSGWYISLPEWTAAHRMRGFAHSWLSLYTDDDGVWANGIDPRYVIRGVHCYDPRYDSTYPGGSGPQRINDQSTWVYSQNPYAIGLTYLIGWRQNGVLVGGVGANPAMIDIAAFVTAANVADFNNWKIGGVFNSVEDPWDVLRRMLSCGGGEPVASGAMISCVVNAPRTSIATVTIDDVSGPVSIPAMKSRRERFNSAIPRYRSESHDWEIVPAGAVTVDAYVTSDGGLNRRELEYSYCQDAKQAGQLAAYDIVNGREFGPLTITLKPKFLGVRAGDAITLNLPESGLNNQLVTVKSRVPNFETCEVTLTVESETTAKHAFALGQDARPPVTAGLTRPDFAVVAPPDAAEWTTAAGAEVDGLPTIVLTRTGDNLPMISEIVVEYRSANDVSWVTWGSAPVSQTRIDVTGIAGLQTYGIAVRYRSIYGVISDRTVLTDVTTPALISDGSAGLVDGGGNIIPAEDVLNDIRDAIDDIQQEITDRIAAIEGVAGEMAEQAFVLAGNWRSLLREVEKIRDYATNLDYGQWEANQTLRRELKADIDGNAASFVEQITVAVSATQALAEKVVQLDAETASLNAQIVNVNTTLAGEIEGLAQQLALLSVGTVNQFDQSNIWYFDTTTEGWTGSPSDPTVTTPGFLRPANGAGGYVLSPAGLGVDGVKYAQVRARLRRTGTPTWQGYLWWRAEGQSWDAGRRVTLPAPTWDSDVTLITFDPEWSNGVDQIRLELVTDQSAGNFIEFDWIAIGRPAPGASSAQLAAEQSARIAAQVAMATDIASTQAALSATNTSLSGVADTVSGMQSVVTDHGDQLTAQAGILDGLAVTVAGKAGVDYVDSAVAGVTAGVDGGLKIVSDRVTASQLRLLPMAQESIERDIADYFGRRKIVQAELTVTEALSSRIEQTNEALTIEALKVLTLQGQMFDANNNALAQANLIAAQGIRLTEAEGDIEVMAFDMTQLAAAQGALSANLTNNYYTKVAADAAIAAALTEVNAQFGGITAGGTFGIIARAGSGTGIGDVLAQAVMQITTATATVKKDAGFTVEIIKTGPGVNDFASRIILNSDQVQIVSEDGRFKFSGSLIEVFDENDVRRLRLGVWS